MAEIVLLRRNRANMKTETLIRTINIVVNSPQHVQAIVIVVKSTPK